jgi:hypothetical protein
MLLLAAATMGPEPAGFWVPAGFVARADTLIQRGHLELRCSEQDSIAVRFPAGSAEEEFYNLSYLRGDVRTFNSSPDASRSPFLVEGCRLRGVDPFYHRIDLPFNRLPRWRGDIAFTFDGLTATLEGGRSQLLEVRHPVDGAEAATRSVRVSPEDRGARVYAPLLQLRRPRTPEVLADLFYVGQSAVLAERIDAGRPERVLLNGFEVPPGRMLELESGDWLELELPGGLPGRPSRHTYLVETGERARTASFTRIRNDQVQRLFPAERLRPLLEPFSQAMDLALQSIPGGADPAADVANMNVRLTIDRELSGQAEAALVAWCARNRHPTRARVVSMLVMDAFTGGVRAMPSCPGAEELAPYEPLSGRTRESFLRNQNLVPHPIGSAGKPFWAAAIATTYPNFLDLQVPSHPAGTAGDVLGCRLRAAYNDTHGSAASVGLEEFLERSCNRYLVEAATAALAVRTRNGIDCRTPRSPDRLQECFVAPHDSAPGAELRFCDRIVRVVLSPEVESVGRSCSELQLLDSKFAPGPIFSAITNVATYRELSPAPAAEEPVRLNESYRAERYRIDAWRRVLERLREAGDTAHFVQTSLRFAAVSPQAANLALNTVEELRTDWVNLLLGGENSRWSNFELAAALGRLVTARDIAGEFVDSVGWPGARHASEPSPLLGEERLHPGVRRRVLHALELVASTGTARALAPQFRSLRERVAAIDPAAPWELYVFAKTGTPNVEKFLTSNQQQLLLRLYHAGDLRRDASNGRILLRPIAEERVRQTWGDATLQWIRDDVLGPIEQNPAAFTAREGDLPDHPLYLDERGQLRARELPDLRVTRQGGVLILGLLAVPHDAGRAAAARRADWIAACPVDPDLRRSILEVPPPDLLDPDRAVALSAAIFVDDLPVGQGSGQAIDVARQLTGALGAYLEKEIRKKTARLSTRG